MQCRQCGTEIADKALICYRCGTATTEATFKPAAIGRRRLPLIPIAWAAAAAAAALIGAALYTAC